MAISKRKPCGAIMIRGRHITPNFPRRIAVAEHIPSVIDEVRVLIEKNENHGRVADARQLEELRPTVKYSGVGVVERADEHVHGYAANPFAQWAYRVVGG